MRLDRCRRFTVAAAILLLVLPGRAGAGRNRLVCESGTWIAEGLPPLAIGDERSLGDTVVVDLAAQTVRISGCDAVPAVIQGKRNFKLLKAEFPLGACPGVEGITKFKGTLKECSLLKAKLTTPNQKRRLRLRRMGAIVPMLEEESAVDETIGPAGGSLETTDAAGRRYVLVIPEGAIPFERLVTLTPVVALDGAPVDRLLGAVDFEPAGLRLAPPATLTVELPEPAAPEGLVAFAYRDDRPELELYPALADASTVSMPVWHFSGVGAGANGSGAAQSYAAQAQSAAGDPQLLTAVCATWFDGQLEPALMGALTDAQLTMAIADFGSWQSTCSAATDSGRRALSLALLQAALERGVQRLAQECSALQSFEAASDIKWLGFIAELASVANGALDPDAINEAVCVEVSYVDTSYPGNPPVGVNQTLSVTVGAAFDGGSPVFTQPLRVDVTASGALPANGGGRTDGSGSWSGSFAVDGTGDAMFEIDSCIAAPAYPNLSSICQQAFVVRGLEVSPSSATIVAGASQQFEAQRFGQAYPSVTWSASGGTISASGLFSAPAAGTYTITATDTASAGSSATASVTVTGVVVGNCVDTSTFIPVGQNANVKLGDQVDGLAIVGTTPILRTLSDGACTVTSRTFGFGHSEATLSGGSADCGNSTLRAFAGTTDYVRITPADSTRFVATVRGSYEYEVSGSASPSAVPNPIRGSAGHSQGMWAPVAGGFSTGTSYQSQGTLAVELTNQPGRTFFPMAWRVSTQGLVAPTNHTVQVSARLRWLGITQILDQDGNPILDYQYCSSSGTDYRQAVP